METATTHTLDLYRIFIGDQPLTFLIEILFRTAIMYFYVLLLLRLLGKRGMGQLSPFEFTIIIALGSAVGDPMFYPEVPLLHCLAVVSVVVALTRFVTYLSNRSEAVEDFLEGQPCSVISDGELNLEALDGERFSREELFMMLRERNVSQLGQVRQAYLEASGAISAFRAKEDECKPGLPIIPPFDEWTPASEFSVAGKERTPGVAYACWACGHVEVPDSSGASADCGRCNGGHWTVAQTDPFGAGCHRPNRGAARQGAS